MKTLIAILTAVSVLAPSGTLAGKSKRTSVTTCSSTSNYFGTKTTCRTR